MTTFCSQEWLILLGRFVSEFIYISYLAMQPTSPVPSEELHTVLCKICTEKPYLKKFLFLISV